MLRAEVVSEIKTNILQTLFFTFLFPIPVAARSKSCVCGCPLAGIVGPAESMFVCYECCVLSVRGLCDGLITRPEESYGCQSVVSVVCCQLEVSATD